MTEMLYYEDPHRTEFEARVVATEPAGAEGTGRVWVELDRTCFYPEGGGQPADRGRIGDEVVLDVQKTDGRILHLVEPGGDDPRGDGAGGDATGAPGGGPPLEAGAAVRGRVDARMRRDYMQQHTGQHIISAAMIEIGGYETISVHQGEEYTSVDFAAADIPAADLERAEARANAVVGENRPVKTFYTESSEAASLGLRRPPKFEGTLRIVEVEGIDRVACGGVHCERTGEVGMIKLIGTDRIRGNVRTFWKIGDRALADYRLKTEVCNTLVDTFSAKVPELPARAEKLEVNLKQAEWEIGRLQKRLAAELAERLAAGADTPGRHPVVTHHFDGEAKELFRAVAEDLAARAGLAACLTNEVDGRLQWIITAGEGVDLDFARVRGELLPLIDGKGGGKPPIWQGVGEAPQGASAFAAAFDALLAGSGPEGA
jgi:alanyl-tRNA synthetase